MTCRRALAVVTFLAAMSARGEELKVVSGAVLYETGLAAPVIELRSVAEDGAVWRAGISGWAISVDRERPIERGRRLIFGITATPYDAHSSRRIYVDGARAPELEFDDAALVLRGGMRIRESEHASIDSVLIAGYDRVGSDAPQTLRNDWRSPYAGIQVTQNVRFVTADDPFIGRIDGVDLTGTAEVYRGNRTWTRGMITENAGRTLGRIHLRQSFAAFGGSRLDAVNAFLVGGSWDVLGPMAVYGRRYAEFRLKSGATLNAGADVSLTRSLDLGVRASALRADSTHATGTMLLVTQRFAGFRLAAGVARSHHRTTVMMTFGGATFLR